MKMFRYVFEDGAVVIARKLSAHEVKIKEREHGKLIHKESYL